MGLTVQTRLDPKIKGTGKAFLELQLELKGDSAPTKSVVRLAYPRDRETLLIWRKFPLTRLMRERGTMSLPDWLARALS